MKLFLLRWTMVASLAVVVGGAAMRAQPQAPNSVQVGVPQGAAQNQTGSPQQRQQEERNRLASQPAPRTADGHIVLGNTTTLKGVWIGGGLGFCNSNTVPARASLNPGAAGPAPAGGRGAGGRGAGGVGGGRAGAAPCTPIPYMPWTLAVSDDRRRNELEPHTRCKPSGSAREFLTPYGVEFVELAEAQRVYIFDIGGPHTFRTIYMDGRTHPADFTPTYYGHSIGWWEGDTLVVDSVGFNERFWIDRGQLPHTDKLHLIEKYTRTSLETMRYELTVDDPAAYTATFTGVSNLRWQADTELFEYICQQANQAHTLMVGDATSVDRTSPIVP